MSPDVTFVLRHRSCPQVCSVSADSCPRAYFHGKFGVHHRETIDHIAQQLCVRRCEHDVDQGVFFELMEPLDVLIPIEISRANIFSLDILSDQ